MEIGRFNLEKENVLNPKNTSGGAGPNVNTSCEKKTKKHLRNILVLVGTCV